MFRSLARCGLILPLRTPPFLLFTLEFSYMQHFFFPPRTAGLLLLCCLPGQSPKPLPQSSFFGQLGVRFFRATCVFPLASLSNWDYLLPLSGWRRYANAFNLTQWVMDRCWGFLSELGSPWLPPFSLLSLLFFFELGVPSPSYFS